MIARITRGNDRAAARVEGVRQGLRAAGLAWPAAWFTERALGLCVPESLSVVGFDDLEFAAHAVTAFTTVRSPAQAAG